MMAVVKANRKDLPETPSPMDFHVLDILISSPDASPKYPSLVRYAILVEGKVLCECEAKFTTATPSAVLKAINEDVRKQSVRIGLLKELRFRFHNVEEP
jgi:hypothetical protein